MSAIGPWAGRDHEILDHATRSLVGFAAATGLGDEAKLADRARLCLEGEVPPVWLDELLLQSVLMVGYPRALVAAGVWRRVSGLRAPASDASFGESAREWAARGEATCALVYGANYERLRENVRALHPALDAWMITEGYGRVLSRPRLDLLRRELCTVAQIAVLHSPHQLHSHLRGALHAGATAGMVKAALAVADQDLSDAARATVMETLSRVVGDGRPGG